MWSPKNRYKDEAVPPVRRPEEAEARAPTVREAGYTKPDVSPAAASVIVVGPPGCCGCVPSVGSARRPRARQD